MSREYPDRPWVGVVAVVRRGAEFLLVERGQEPHRGWWGFPGGVQHLGETLEEAAARELSEETGVCAAAPRVLTAFDAIERGLEGRVRRHFALVAVGFTWISGEGAAADDAAAVGWFRLDALGALKVLPRVAEVMGRALDLG